MEAFTIEHWLETLAKVYERAILDPVYRDLCLTDPRAAVAAVSNIALPADFNFEFVADRKDVFYSFLLPPPLEETHLVKSLKEILEAVICSTHPTFHPPP